MIIKKKIYLITTAETTIFIKNYRRADAYLMKI
jgi:hypothetical protein